MAYQAIPGIFRRFKWAFKTSFVDTPKYLWQGIKEDVSRAYRGTYTWL